MSGYSTKESGTNFDTIYTQYYYTEDQLINHILVLNGALLILFAFSLAGKWLFI